MKTPGGFPELRMPADLAREEAQRALEEVAPPPPVPDVEQ